MDSTFADKLHNMALALDDDDPRTLGALKLTEYILWKRYQAGYRASDLERVISTCDRFARLTPDNDPEKGHRLVSLGRALHARFLKSGDVSDIERACFCFKSSLLNEPRGERACRWMGNLGCALMEWFARTGSASELTPALEILQKAVDLSPDEHPDKPDHLNNLGTGFITRFNSLGDVSDLDMAISVKRQAAELTPNGHPEKPSRLDGLGSAFQSRFGRLGNVSDLEIALSVGREAVELTLDGHSDKPGYLTNLGTALQARFDRIGDVSDLEMALSVKRQAVELTLDGHPEKPSRLSNLSNAFIARFDRLGDVSDLKMAISVKRQAIDLTPEGHPAKPGRLKDLAGAFQRLFHRIGVLSDLEEAISIGREAVELTPNGHPDKPSRLNHLGMALQTRSDRLGAISDLEEAISIKRQAVELTPDGHPEKPSHLDSLGNALQTRFERLGEVSDLDMAVSVKRQAIELTADGHPDKPGYLGSLGNAVQRRFYRHGDLSDLEMAVFVKRQAVELTPDGHPEKPGHLSNLGTAFEQRFDRLGDVSDLEMAVSVNRRAADLSPDGHPDKPGHLTNLGTALQKRFERLGHVSDLDVAVSIIRQAVGLIPDRQPNKPVYLNNLGNAFDSRFNRLGDVSDLEMAVSVKREAVELTPDGHPDKPSRLSNLGNAYQRRFNRLGDVSDLEMAVSVKRQAAQLTPYGHINKPSIMFNLAWTLMRRYRHHGRVSDREEAIKMISTAAQSVIGLPRILFNAARRWSELTEEVNDEQQMLRAYDCAIGLIPRVAWMGLPIEGKHRELERIGKFVRKAASAAIKSGDAARALEWLEQGRSVVWGQTLQQRSSLDLLKEIDPIRADRLTEISRALESNAKDTVLPSETQGVQLRALVLEWDGLVLEVRKLEGFEDFLGPKKMAQLLPAASSCPVVVLNAHDAGCDALVLRAETTAVMQIPLELNSETAQSLLVALEKVQTGRSLERHADPVERHVEVKAPAMIDPDVRVNALLAELWNKVVKPVLDGLALSLPENDTEDLPRICWCPTGPLAFLPLHAAGLYDDPSPGTKVFDYVVSSYTPTVTALLQVPHETLSQPRILAVAQSTTPGQMSLPYAAQEVDILRDRATANVVEIAVTSDNFGTVKHVQDEMDKYQWIHFACHGVQDLDNPTESAFILSDGKLKLSEIIKHSLPNAEFAFLSACKTATGDEKLSEEAVHLAAGMMLAGYRSVIATMWSIRDRDGPVVAEAVYSEMLKDGKADYTRAPFALHHAVQKLRLSGAPFLAWMPFIHMGR